MERARCVAGAPPNPHHHHASPRLHSLYTFHRWPGGAALRPACTKHAPRHAPRSTSPTPASRRHPRPPPDVTHARHNPHGPPAVIFLRATYAELTKAGYTGLDPKHELFLLYREKEDVELIHKGSVLSPRPLSPRPLSPRPLGPVVLPGSARLREREIRPRPHSSPRSRPRPHSSRGHSSRGHSSRGPSPRPGSSRRQPETVGGKSRYLEVGSMPLQVRSGAALTSKRVGVLPQGMRLRVIDRRVWPRDGTHRVCVAAAQADEQTHSPQILPVGWVTQQRPHAAASCLNPAADPRPSSGAPGAYLGPMDC